jgi:hypothetical protein
MNTELNEIRDTETNRVIGNKILEYLHELWTQEGHCPEEGDVDHIVGLSMQMTIADPKDHLVAEHVNNLREIAVDYMGSSQLREHLRQEVYRFKGRPLQAPENDGTLWEEVVSRSNPIACIVWNNDGDTKKKRMIVDYDKNDHTCKYRADTDRWWRYAEPVKPNDSCIWIDK